MRLLLIDNYDSFTYNLAHLIAEALGRAPDVLRNDAIDWDGFLAAGYDAVVISPGPGRPDRAADFGLCARVLKQFEGPVLGVCLGHQGLGLAGGGVVTLAPTPMHGRVSRIRHKGEGLFEGLPATFEATRYHSLIVSEIGPELEATAWTEDGLIMGLSHRSRPRWGVQFHPESIASECGVELIRNFGRLAGWKPSAPSKPAPKPAAGPDQSPLTLFWRELDAWIDPEICFTALYAGSEEAFWLDGAVQVAEMGRFSYMGDASGPWAMSLSYETRARRLRSMGAGAAMDERCSIFDRLDDRLSALRISPPDGFPPPFCGGYVGYLGYELKEECGAAKGAVSDMPDAWMLFADRFLAFDAETRRVWIACLDAPVEAERAQAWLDETEAWLEALGEASPPSIEPVAPMAFAPHQNRGRYAGRIAEAKAEIRQGESYELCLTNVFAAEIAPGDMPDPLNAYRALRAVNPAPYAAYLRLGGSAVLSSSPERFLTISPEGEVETKPIKGTAPRGETPEEDRRIAEALQASEKDRAENLMIVDLLRNDLGRVCAVGSVHAPSIFAVESYATVHQLVSTVRGRLESGVSPVDCVRAAFPGGSMTGAPKIRSMAILDRLEERARGVYSGAIGFFSLSGAVDLNIVIRTLVLHEGAARIGAGGAIVDLSDIEGECDEVWLKCRALLKALGSLESSEGAWRGE